MRWMKATPVLLLVLAAALVPLSSAAGSASGGMTKQATGPIKALAMSGSRIAYDVGNARNPNGSGNKVLVWNLLTGKVTQVSGKRTNAADTTSTGSGVRELAIAGKRVAWIVNQGGNTESDDYLCVSSVAKPKEWDLAGAMRSGPYSSSPGDWISGLVGSGSVLAVNRWHADDQGTVTDARLALITPSGLRRIATGPETVVGQSTDGTRIAILRSDGMVAIYSTAGRLLLTVKPPATKELVFRGALIALEGKHLVALTSRRKLEVFDSHTGSLLRTLPLRGPARAVPQNLDVEAGLAVYTVWPDVHVVNLKTGKDRVIGHMRAFFFYYRVFARIEPAGVVYAGNVRNRPVPGSTTGTLVFVPWATVAKAVS
jgi:hypothetical protein